MNINELKNELDKRDIYIDFGHGDKFYVNDFEITDDKIIFKGSQGSLGWVRIDALYPIK
jgi:hypothetical protein